ncbi:MAG: hypothetical protein JXR86_18210 [Spirochaetales bacterium]|nr:hypothetical protein [Spirochaetales bacterium]
MLKATTTMSLWLKLKRTDAAFFLKAGIHAGALIFFLLLPAGCRSSLTPPDQPEMETMNKITTIIAFVRGSEPRDPRLDLVLPVKNQLALLEEYDLPGTFLLMHNALEREDILGLFQDIPDSLELGIWLEMDKGLIEKTGLPWRGRPGFDWDWYAQVGFLIGYTPAEREKIIDVFMNDFKAETGEYPSSAGSWILDSHSLSYMKDKYGIRAAAICRDQWGTDGYSLWGGYYNGGYFPSRENIFMPAQNADFQIDVPVFRMLGSDPVSQYDAGQDPDTFEPSSHQPVYTLEPVWELGQSRSWVQWYFENNFNEHVLSHGFTQTGQENSFGWPQMSCGINLQFSLIARLRDEKKIDVLTLKESGELFLSEFALTPPAAQVFLEDWKERDKGSVWFNSRYYRINLYREGDRIRIRDLYIFNESFPESYGKEPCRTDWMEYRNIPLVDGGQWSGSGVLGAGYFLNSETGEEVLLTSDPTVESDDDFLTIRYTVESSPGVEGEILLVLESENIHIEASFPLYVRISAAPDKEIPFIQNSGFDIRGTWRNFDFFLFLSGGSWRNELQGYGFAFQENSREMTLDFNP